MMFTMMVLVIGGMVKLYCDFSSTHDLTDLKAKEKFDELENLNDSFQRKCWCQKKDWKIMLVIYDKGRGGKNTEKV